MEEVTRACFNCKFDSNEPVNVVPDEQGVGSLLGRDGAFTEFERTEGKCEVCGESPSLRKT